MIGQKLRTEDGIGETVKLIEKYSNDFLVTIYDLLLLL